MQNNEEILDALSLEDPSNSTTSSDEEEQDFLNIPFRPGMGTDPRLMDMPTGSTGLSPLARVLYGAIMSDLMNANNNVSNNVSNNVPTFEQWLDLNGEVPATLANVPGLEEWFDMDGEVRGYYATDPVSGTQRKWNTNGEPVELFPYSIYLAGDWRDPPLKTAAALEAAGCRIVHKWWEPEHRESTTTTLEQLSEHIQQAEWFVMDMRTTHFGWHPLSGSHIAAGIAHEQGSEIIVIAPSEEEAYNAGSARTYTSLLQPFVVDSEYGALEVLRQHREEEDHWLDSTNEDDEEEEPRHPQPQILGLRPNIPPPPSPVSRMPGPVRM